MCYSLPIISAEGNGEFNAQKVVTGPLYQLGDFNQCLYKHEAQYCLTEIHLTPADNSSEQWKRIQVFFTFFNLSCLWNEPRLNYMGQGGILSPGSLGSLSVQNVYIQIPSFFQSLHFDILFTFKYSPSLSI